MQITGYPGTECGRDNEADWAVHLPERLPPLEEKRRRNRDSALRRARVWRCASLAPFPEGNKKISCSTMESINGSNNTKKTTEPAGILSMDRIGFKVIKKSKEESSESEYLISA